MPQGISRRSALAGFGGTVAAALTAAACGRAAASTGSTGSTAASAPAGTAALRRPAGTLLWRSRAVAADQPSVIAAAGRVYVTGGGRDFGNSGVYAFDAATGKPLWRASGPYPYAASASAVYGFAVTSGGATTEVIASDAKTGRTLWTHDAGQMLDSAEVGWLGYAEGLVYIAAGTTEDSTAGQPAVRALDARTGRRVWRAYAGSLPQEPAIAGGLVYIAEADSPASGRLVALDAATGARRWRSPNLGEIAFPQVVGTGGIACCTAGSQGLVCGLDGGTGRELWHARVPGLPLAATEDIVFCFQFSAGRTFSFTVLARHIRTGAPAWTLKFPGQPAIATGRDALYLGYGNRTLQARAAATGHPLWTQQLAATPAGIATANGAVYALDQNGTVYAFQA